MSLSHRVTQLLEQWLSGTGKEAKVQISNGTNEASVVATNGSYGLSTVLEGHECTHNSTSIPLSADGIFTGTSAETLNYGNLLLAVISDVASVENGLEVQFSFDNITWYTSDEYTIEANTLKVFSVQLPTKYYRIKYTNSGSDQTTFNLSAILKPVYSKPSSHRIADSISSQDDAELIKAVLTAYNGTSFTNITSTPSNNLRVTDAENPLAVAKGEVTGASGENKWGNAPDFDSTDGEVDIWDGAEDGVAWESMTYNFSDTNDIDSVSSTNVADTIQVTIEGLRDGLLVTETVTLNGQNKVNFTGMNAINRMYNTNGTLFVGHVIAYVDTAISGGVPIDTTKIRSIIHPEEQQTEQAIYTIPTNKTGYVFAGYCSTAGANKDSNYIIKFKAQEPNAVFRTKQKIAISDQGSSFVSFQYAIPQKFVGGTRLKVTCQISDVGILGASVSAGFSLVLIDN